MTQNHRSLFSIFDTFVFAEIIAYLFSGNRGGFKFNKSITRDFSALYQKLCDRLFPDAVQVWDKFHVIRYLMEAHQAIKMINQTEGSSKTQRGF